MDLPRPIYDRGSGPLLPLGSEQGLLSLLDIRDVLVRRWRLVATVTILLILAGALYILVSPARYTATTSMIIDTKKTSWTQSELNSESRFIDDATVESEIETVKSERVATAVIKRLKLTTDPEFVGSGRQLARRLFDLFGKAPVEEAKLTQEQLLRNTIIAFTNQVKVARVGRSYVVDISFTSLDRVKAATIANSIADAYIEDQLQAKFDATKRASVWLQQRINELKQQASDAYRSVQDYKTENNIIIGENGKLATDLELEQLGSALAKARSDTTQANAKLDRITRVLSQRNNEPDRFNIPDPAVTDALSNPVITKLRQQFLDDQKQESEWTARYGRDHQAARNLRSEMSAIQRAIWDEVQRIGESYKSELQIARSQEEAIDKRMTEVFQKSGDTRQSQVKLRELETSANTYRNIYETFLSRYTQAVQQQSFPSTEARVITYASPPFSKSSPKVVLIMLLSALSGITLGVIAAFGRDQMDRVIHTRSQVERLLGKSCLAVLPLVSRITTVGNRLGLSKRADGLTMIVEDKPFSAAAEALRYMKVAIDLHPSQHSTKIIAFVSALPGEGKTTVAANFAAALARGNARTLLIDADLRNPSLTKVLGYQNAPGLVNLISEQINIADVVIHDAKFRFDFIPASARIKPPNSSDILTSKAMRALLDALRKHYQYIIVDMPPILPVVDVKASAGLFDGFIQIIEWGKTSVDEVSKAISASPILLDRLLGVVLNKTDESAMRRFEGYNSERAYTYYSDERQSETSGT